MWHHPKQIVRNRDMYVNSCDRPCPLCTTRIRRRAPPSCARRRAPALAWDAPGAFRRSFRRWRERPRSRGMRPESIKNAPFRVSSQLAKPLFAPRSRENRPVAGARTRRRRRSKSSPSRENRPAAEGKKESEERRGNSTRHQKAPSCEPVATTASAKAPPPATE
jgi:hypothetical protein